MPHKYGYRRDKYDHRDFMFGAVHAPTSPIPLPPKISLRANMPAVWDQGNLNSCTAHGSLACFNFLHPNQGPFSRLDLYYFTRKSEGVEAQDDGATIRDTIKILAGQGVAPESDWPYVEENVNICPPENVINESSQNKIITYSRLSNKNEMFQCLAGGHPFVFGLQLYDNFESEDVAKNGIIRLPTSTDQPIGGHCMTCVGYNQNLYGGLFWEVRNSWGPDWGDKGYCWIEDDYFTDKKFISDIWVIKT